MCLTNVFVSQFVIVPFSLSEIFPVIGRKPLQELGFFLLVKAVQRVHSFHGCFKALFSAVRLLIFPKKTSDRFSVIVTQSLFNAL